MIKLEKVIVERVPDYDNDLSYLGQFSDTCGEFGIETHAGRGKFLYFNAENVENMDQAQENFDRMMQFENGTVSSICIRAYAKVNINGTVQKIISGGLYGIESDSDNDYLKSIENEELDNLKSQLKELKINMRNFYKLIEYKD